MDRMFRYALWLIGRLILSLRYRVRIIGLEKVKHTPGPILLLPSHPAFVDPPIVYTHLYPYFRPRPLLYEENFQNPFMYPLLFILDAIKVPNLSQASLEAREKTTQAIANVIAALKAGQNVILWPSGRLERAGIEKLGGSRALSEVLKAVPHVKLLLIRTRGLWGSRYSFGYDAKMPPLIPRILQGLAWLMAGLFFLVPKRDVTLTLELFQREQLPGVERELLNPFLENYYHPGGVPEQPTFVPPHWFLGERTHTFPRYQDNHEVDLTNLKPETRQAVEEMVAKRLKRPLPAEATPQTTLDSLGLDSLDRMELALEVERRFGFHGEEVPTTLGQLYALAAGLVKKADPQPAPALWFKPLSGDLQPAILADTISAAFVERALHHPQDVAVADDRSGVLTYEKMLVGALLLSRRFRSLPGEAVGVLLPAAAACDITLQALYLANKLPVLLNWTTGPANLSHAAKLMKLDCTITSKAVIDRLGLNLPETRFIYLEEIGKEISIWEKLTTLLRVRWMPGSVRARVPHPNPDSYAVVLFTSGSEKAPKAVPLTHRNLLTNQRDALQVFGLDRRNSMLGFLPAFHSFGMSITGLFPLLSGFRVVRHPDPTDAAALARKVGLFQTTILVGTPTFVSYILDRAEPGELASLRLVVVGAEKCPQAVFDKMKLAAPQAIITEGYGITECSPTVSVNPPDAVRPGTVGKPFPSVQIKVIDLHTQEELGPNQLGMLLVAGPSVFPGYIGSDAPSPFKEIEGQRWYVTGDLVELTEEGYIRFQGRLKRFIKAGGEMVSLPALEEPLARLFPPNKEGPRVAVEAVELEGGGQRIVLFTTEDISLTQANDILLKEGFHGVMRLDEVRRIDAIPVLGTGKTDYKILRAKILQPAGANP